MPTVQDGAESHSQVVRLVADYWPFMLAASLVVVLSRTYFNRGLHRYPGPFLANFTDAWRAWDVRTNRHQHTMVALHERYGPVVRTGPNTVDISDAEYVPKIYGINKGFTKTAFYDAFVAKRQGRLHPSIFADRDEKQHSEKKREVGGMYSLSALQEYEPLVDEMIRLFTDRLEHEFDGPATKGTPCDMAAWLQYYAFDVILNIVFGNTLGFMAQGADAGGFMAQLERNMDAAALWSQVPGLHALQHPLRSLTKSDASMFQAFVGQQVAEHTAKMQSDKGAASADMLTRFLAIPGVQPDRVRMHALSNVIAGSDTTAISLRATLYFLLKHPRCMAKLLAELRAHDPPLAYPVTWKESQSLPYLRAVIDESLRLFPAVGLSLEREVPAPGMAMPDGYVLPAGAAIGMNAWAVHRQPEVFGPLPVHEFVPERWLPAEGEAGDAYEERLARMKRADLAFGWGKRICLGRNISFLEIYKVVPTLLLEFEIGLVDPAKEWSTINRWFVRQTGMDCWLRRRVNRA